MAGALIWILCRDYDAGFFREDRDGTTCLGFIDAYDGLTRFGDSGQVMEEQSAIDLRRKVLASLSNSMHGVYSMDRESILQN